jgi:iron complex outermembrane recepter protein
MNRLHFVAIATLIASLPAFAAEAPTVLPDVQVTATRDAEPVSTLPASLTIVSGEELRARGANDLRTALTLVAGVQGTPTGDAGPAGSVPALWGLREIDSFLLVIDGVPAGGAFNPATVAVDMTGVERIEVLRGAAPVMFGATSFNGVIHIIHYAAGKAPGTAGVGAGSYGSYGASYFGSLSENQSLTANIEQRGFSVDDQEYRKYHVLYRLGLGGFHLDADINVTPQKPGSTTFRNGGTLRKDLVPDDANHNPSDARMDQKRYQLNAGYTAGISTTTLSVAQTRDDIIRGFHEANAGTNAHGYEQEREITDIYFDTHLTHELAQGFKLGYGVDYLYGRGEQEAFRFPYMSGVDGSGRWSSAQARANCSAAVPNPAIGAEECVEGETEVERNFAGLYVQADWAVTEAVNLLAGLRLNQTHEMQEGEDDSVVPPAPVKEEDSNTRLSGVIGANFGVWRSGNDSLNLYADYRNSFKPLAAELAPEPAVNILEPETGTSYEVGTKGNLANGRVHYDASLFQMDFKNGRTFDAGVPVNGGHTRFKGGEIEAQVAVIEALQIAGSYAYHDSRFVRFTLDDGTVVDGRRFETAPHHVAALGVLYVPAQGFNATVVGNHTGQRVLNKRNSLSVGSFTTVDATVGWQARRFGVQLAGYNLTDRRDAVAESELSEELAGASSYYLLPARRVMLNFNIPLQ